MNKRIFISTKKEYLDSYLDSLSFIDECVLIQLFQDEYAYYEYNNQGNFKYLKSNKNTEEISKQEFYNIFNANNHQAMRIIKSHYIDGDYDIFVNNYLEPVKMHMIEVSSSKSLSDYSIPKGLLEVSDMKVFDNYSIYNGSIISNNTIIEGTDGVGKTATILKLLKLGIICQDRCMDYVSNKMFFDIEHNIRAKCIEEYLNSSDKHIIFLVNNSKEELESRINARSELSIYDLEAYKYNQLYYDTYKYMEERGMLHDKLHLVDCTHLLLDDQVEKVRKVIKSYNA